jgi:hypothetical protein
MATARITLNDSGPLTYEGNGYKLERGQAIITSKDDDIVHFGAQPGFTIDMLKGEKPKAVVAKREDEDEGSSASGPEEETDGPVDGELTEVELMKLNKGPLLELADERGAKADNSMNKKDIVAAILAHVAKDS